MSEKPVTFSIEAKLPGKLGRAGVIHTPHGDIRTPAFIVVGTKATVKALTPEQVSGLGAQAVLANTYHLYLQPGDELVRDAGGIQKFMNWQGPTMTDSGGFQVFSLGAAYGKGIGKVTKEADPNLMLPEASEDLSNSDMPKLAKIDADGVMFKSHLDGSAHYITPEKSMDIQHNLGADIIFAFDECTSPIEPIHYQKEALERTHRWAKRSLEYHRSKDNGNQKLKQGLFGIVQGGRHEELRKESAETLAGMDFDGYGIGGSFAKEDMSTAVRWVNSILPEDKPRHLLGIGEPADLFMGAEDGVDTFDCVAPTRIARTGMIYTKTGKINLLNEKFIRDFSRPDDCECYTCRNYTKAYLAHLFRAKEMLGATLASIHNLYFLVNLVDRIRASMLDGSFETFKKSFLSNYGA